MVKNFDNLNDFPYVDYAADEHKWNKCQYPLLETNTELKDRYKAKGHKLERIERLPIVGDEANEGRGFRFNVEKRYYSKPDGKEYTNMEAVSKASAEVVALQKRNGVLGFCFAIQPRTPYLVNVDGELFARYFIEQPAGMLEKGETFTEAAIRELKEELGFNVLKLDALTPLVHRHVSYTNETSIVFYALVGEDIGQNLDENEDIERLWYSLEEVEEEFNSYMDGESKFFGFDIPDLTIIGLQEFFRKFKNGKIQF